MTQYPQQPYPMQQPPQPPVQPPKKRRTWLIVTLAVLGTLLVGFVGCVAVVGTALDGTDAEKSSVEPTTTPTGETYEEAQRRLAEEAARASTPPAVEETNEPPAATSDVAKIGATQWFTYDDGLRVQVTKVQRFKISSTAAGGSPGAQGVKVTVTLENKTGETFDAALASVKLQSGPNGDEAETVYDSENNVGGGFEGSIVNGRKKTAVYGFAVPKTHKAVLVEVAPSWDHDASHFEGTLK